MRYWIGIAALLAAAAAAPAQVAEFGAFGGAYRLRGNDLGQVSFDGTSTFNVSLDDSWLMGFRVTLNSYRFFGHEFGYSYNRTSMKFGGGEGASADEGQGTAIHRGFYNFLTYALPEGSVVRPFATGGLHFNNYARPGMSAASGGGSTKFGFNYGGGVKIRVSPRFGIRLDVRDYWNGKPFDFPGQSGMIRQLEISAGFSLLL